MGTRDEGKRPLTAKERRQRELRRKRRRKKKMIRLAIIVSMAILAIALIAFIVYMAVKLVGGRVSGEEPIKPKGETFVIMLDAGHGGADIGLSNGELEEKTVTMDIIGKLQVMLESNGYQVVLTRADDSRLSKEERVQAVKESQADLLVSVHLNYSEDESASGIETYYRKGSDQSKLLADKVLASAVAETEAKDGGAHTGAFTILNDVEIPAVLVEVGYASNAREAGSLTDDSYQNLAAKGIAKGIIRSLDLEEEDKE
ncbi:MAG: N-acetylmuramoyl-L-alanine amidase [Lachnospiraceae bacterium]|nr:N-acetylmuramoyl-L-alanine amidase [Lachnospiraceae bacterium]